jgi:hypothetical protein
VTAGQFLLGWGMCRANIPVLANVFVLLSSQLAPILAFAPSANAATMLLPSSLSLSSFFSLCRGKGLPIKLVGGGGCGANSDFDSKNAWFCSIILFVLRGVRFPPHKDGPWFESRLGRGTLRGILQ